jgi:hypothetical protein
MQSKVIRILLVLCVAVMMNHNAAAQKYRPLRAYVEPDGWSIGANIGMTDMWGDVGTKSALDHYTNSKYFDKVSFMGGMFGRYSFHPVFAVRFMLNVGSAYATDEWNYDGVKGDNLLEGKDYVQRYLRSQNAKSTIIESSVLLELTPRRFNIGGKAFKRRQPYLAAGVALFHYTPYSTIGKSPTFVKTYELSLEGQGWEGGTYPKQNGRWQPAFPLAIGYRWDLGDHLNLGIEYMYRMTMFDYLDGVSGKYVSAFEFNQNLAPNEAQKAIQVADKQPFYNNSLPSTPGTLRGNPGNNDAYSTLTVTFSFKVPSRSNIWWSHRKF